MNTYLGVNLKLKREKLLKSDAAKPLINEIISKADKALSNEYPHLTYSEYMIYKESGSRIEYEQKYFPRRQDCAYLLMALYLTEDEKYLKPICDLIFLMCDEFSWCLPAHARLNENNGSEFIFEMIDLFQGETARLLCECYSVVGDVLPPLVRDRIKFEIRRRIIKPILKNSYWWFELKSNWAAVCSGCVAVGVLTFGTDEEKKAIIPTLDKCIDNFIDGFTDDGCCTEGYTYWNYGIRHFLIYAEMMREYTNGERDYFKDEKVKKIALFPQRIRLGKSKAVCFSDSKKDFFFMPGVMGKLKEIYGDEFACPDMKLYSLAVTVVSVKELLWFDTDYKDNEDKKFTSYFDSSQWFVKQGANYSFAAKGGNNMEEHNHNDVGSFMVVSGDDSVVLDDFGCARYTYSYFLPETRYQNLNCGSQGHSVPIINGEYQCFGKEFKAENVSAAGNTFSMDIEGAYKKGIIDKITRKFELFEESIILTDTFLPNENTKSITERFVSEIKPEVSCGEVKFESAIILFDENRYDILVTETSYLPHDRNLSEKDTVDVYLIDFKAKSEKETEFKFEIKIK